MVVREEVRLLIYDCGAVPVRSTQSGKVGLLCTGKLMNFKSATASSDIFLSSSLESSFCCIVYILILEIK